MKERDQILRLWREMREHGLSGVLITVVKTIGSSYRRPGARLLLAANGARVGSISGGCLEDDVVKKAWWLTEKGPTIRRYDTTPDGEIGEGEPTSGGFGLGCNGIVYLLLDPIIAGENTALAVLERVYLTRQAQILVHTLAPAAFIGSVMASEDLTGDPRPENSRGRLSELSSGDLFVERLIPPLRLLIFGAGDDAIPLGDLARLLGWQVSVFDGRAHYARREKFPQAQEVAVLDSTESLEPLRIDDLTAAVVMTHSYSQDLNFLKRLAVEPLAYLGVLGPRKRTARLITDCEIMSDIHSLRTPIGLDIGAEGPEQIALSVVAEIQATMNGRNGGSLHSLAGPLHLSERGDAAPLVPSA